MASKAAIRCRRFLRNCAHAPWQFLFGKVPLDVTAEAEEVHRRTLIPDRAPGKKRAPNAAYTILRSPIPAQYIRNPSGRGRLDVHPRPKRRAAQTAYAFSYTYPADSTTPEECVTRSLFMPNAAPGRRRAANGAYWGGGMQWMGAAPQIPEDIPLPSVNGRLLPDRAPGKKRAPTTAYIVLVSPQIQDELAPAEGAMRTIMPSVARGPRRAGIDAYKIIARLVYEDVAEAEEVHHRRLIPVIAYGYKRTAASAYFVFDTPQIADTTQPPNNYWITPTRIFGKARAGNSAYQIINGVPGPPFSIGQRAFYIPHASDVSSVQPHSAEIADERAEAAPEEPDVLYERDDDQEQA